MPGPPRAKVAWSDNLSYDSEEEREKERIARLEQLEAEDEKPVYLDDELNTIIGYFKKITTLYSLCESDWNQNCINTIKDYIMTPKSILLTIFFEDGTLKALQSIPTVVVYDLTYFIRDMDQVFTVDDFHDEITFGTFVESVEGSLLKLLEVLYAPAFLSSPWPAIVRDEFCTHLNIFLSEMTTFHHKMQGLTILYVPREGLDMSVEEACSSKGIAQRLESVVVHWTHLLKAAIEDNEINAETVLLCPMDKFNFWKYRLLNLSCIKYQIESKNIKHIVLILTNTRSSIIDQFKKLAKTVNECIVEAKSNMEYLQVLKEPCEALENSKDPTEIPQHISLILNTFRFIWMESPYFHSEQQIVHLCVSLSNQVIIQCSTFINLDDLLDGKTRHAMEELRICIECCKEYRLIYDTVADAHNTHQAGSWGLDVNLIFYNIDSFTQRCVDLLDICNGMIIFGRIDETEEILFPKFTGTKGEELEKVCVKIEKKFNDALQIVKDKRYSILNVYDISWYRTILDFRKSMDHLEMLIKNLVDYVFKLVNNVEEGVQALCATYYYSKRKYLKNIFQRKTFTVWNMFNRTIEDVKQKMVDERHCRPAHSAPYSGEALLLSMKKHNLKYLQQILNSNTWMMNCSIATDCMQKCEGLIEAINLSVTHIWETWRDSLKNDLASQGLDRFLICESTSHRFFIECNINRDVLTVYKEAVQWNNLEKDIPDQAKVIFTKGSSIVQLYENIILIVKDYNKIISYLSTEERELFYPLTQECMGKIKPGMMSIRWSASNTDTYVSECVTGIQELQDFIDRYKLCNEEVVKILEKICSTLLMNFEDYDVFELEEFMKSLQTMWRAGMDAMLEYYHQIITFLTIVFEGIEKHIKHIPTPWARYIKHFDDLLEVSILRFVRTSMRNLLNIVVGDVTVGPLPLINMKMVLRNNKIVYEPTHKDTQAVFDSVFPNIIDFMREIPRLHEKFSLPAGNLKPFCDLLKIDTECSTIDQNIKQEVLIALNSVRDNAESWFSYENVWNIDKEKYMEEYLAQNPTSEDFETDIQRYMLLSQEVQSLESTSQVQIILLNYGELIAAIIENSTQWQELFVFKLKEIMARDLAALYSYMEVNAALALKKPETLQELQKAIETHRRLHDDVAIKEAEMPEIRNKIDALVRFEVEDIQEIIADAGLMQPTWEHYLSRLEEAKKNLNVYSEYFKNDLLEQTEKFKEDAATLKENFFQTLPVSSELSSKEAMRLLQMTRKQLASIRENENAILAGLNVFNLSLPVNQDLVAIDRELENMYEVWELVAKWEEAWESYRKQSFWTLDSDEIEENVQDLSKAFTRISRIFKDKDWPIVPYTRNKVDTFRKTLPLLTDLKNPSMRKRHWDRIRNIMNSDFDENSVDFNLDLIIQLNFEGFSDDISEISKTATMELNIENGLKAIRDVWAGTMFEMEPHRDKIYKIKNVDEVTQFLEDHQVQLSTMKSTKYVEPFIEEVEYWEKTLGFVAESIEMALQVQRRWLYLENIFLGEDVQKQLPEESAKFKFLSNEWMDITQNMQVAKNAIQACLFKPFPYLLEKLNYITDELEIVQRKLESFLETKRMLFPRFYFISNDDLLEILGNSKKPAMVQMHLKKLFDNLYRMVLDKNGQGNPVVKGIMSEDGEVVDLKPILVLDGPAEAWLLNLETQMRIMLKQLLLATRIALKKAGGDKREKWIDTWPGQLTITSSKMQWTNNCIRHITMCKLAGNRRPLKKLRKKQNKILQLLLIMSRKNIPKMLRLKVNALAVIEVHSRDVVDKLYRVGCTDVSTFEWFSQLKFFWDTVINDCLIRQTNTESRYTYEYIGNSGRLVITPLTDRCYITLTMALNFFRGGSPQGPAGTGKTETVKDLGRALARWVVVTNCSDGLDYKSMAKCFAGIAQSGCWGCFDEFNRINIEVLSVVAQQIFSILLALTQGLTRFIFEGCEIKLIHYCGIFITMNPGYAGRTELPDNLKSMFRPISMCVPDNLIIAENTLFSDGFQEYKLAAKKVFTLYELAKRQLSKQDHYDFGLRSMVALLRYAGVKRRAHPHIPEMEITILAMRDMNVARLTAKDVLLFNGIIKDIFPESSIPAVDYEVVHKAITEEMRIAGLQPIPIALLKVVQVMETKNSRHSTMVLGDTNTAKSVTWKMLMKAMIRLKRENKPGFENVFYYPINPKALNLAELYGEYNLSTGEWTDGVISSIMRTTCQDESSDQKWIVFDGPVDALWIENLNSVMDDNKLLTLVNSERISMPAMVSLLFEARDLAVASPATVSRCGMVYNDYKDWGWWPFVNSWLETIVDDTYRKDLRELFEYFLQRVLDFKRLHLSEGQGMEGQELTGIRSMCQLLTILAPSPPVLPESESNEEVIAAINKMWFLFCLIWSICATLDEESRRKFDTWLRELEGIFPIKGTVYDYYVDPQRKSFTLWEEKLSNSWSYNPELGFHSILVPTVESYRVQYLSGLLIKSGHGILLGGPSGTGKSSLMQSVINEIDSNQYNCLIMNISAQTSSKNVQDMIEARLEKRNKENFVPIGGKRLLAIMDDMNMPARDDYGSQPPLEFIRQWIDYGFWYDRLKQWKKNIKGMVIGGAIGHPGGARSPLPSRLLSCFHSFYLPTPPHSQLIKIFGTMINQHFVDFHEETKLAGKTILVATIDIFNQVISKLLPTPMKMHYLFNLRDISRIFQGLLRSNKDTHSTKSAILRLWVHENYRVFFDRLVDEIDRGWFANLMNDILGKHFDTTFNAVCPEKTCPVFGDFMNPYKIYEDIPDMDVLRAHIEQMLANYNSSPGVVRMDLVLFRYAIEHIVRVIRVISQARGNLLLIGIGGSGRQSLSRLASFICDYNSYQVSVTNNYGLKEFREDLKVLYLATGVSNRTTTFIFSDTQVTEESFLEIINNLLSCGEVSNLFKPDEFEDIKSSLERPMKNANVIQTNENVYNFLVNRVRDNLHVVLCMSPIGDDFRNRLRQYPALISCSTIDWFLEWPRDALLEVASKLIMDLNLCIAPVEEDSLAFDSFQNEQTKKSEASVMSLIHSSVNQYCIKMYSEVKRTNYVTPTNYLELVYGYRTMLQNKREEVSSNANKLRNGLQKLEETQSSVAEMSIELEVAKKQVAEFTQQLLEYMGEINLQQQIADEQQKSVTVKSQKITEEEIVCKKLADAAMKDLAAAMPPLQEAMAALDALNKKDITEIKSYAQPPKAIKVVLEAVMVVLQKPLDWANIKKVIGEQYFLDDLRNFDKDHIPEKVLKKMRDYTRQSTFDPEDVGKVSIAAKSLCLWVRAIEKYAIAFKVVKPKQDRLNEALASLAEMQRMLAEAEEKLRQLSEQLAQLQAEYNKKVEEKEELNRKAQALQQKLDRADALVEGLGGEKDRWIATVKSLDKTFTYLPGDCLIATAFISYLGPFDARYREALVDLWINEVTEKQIPHNEDINIKQFLLDDALLREWNLWGLPGDTFSAENAIIVTNATRWPLVVDPQGQALIWISNMEKKNGIKVIEACQATYLSVLGKCLIDGSPVLIQNIVETLDPSIEPILNRALIRIGNRVMIKFNQMVIDYNSNFRLFLATKLGNPVYTPEVLTKTAMVNFAVTEQGLQAQLLGIVVRKEVPELEEMRNNLVVSIAKNKKFLIDLENNLLRLMNESEGSLLENDELFSTLQISRVTSVQVKEALQTAQVTEVEINAARQGYIPVAERAAVLFFVLNDLSMIDPMYQFSLEIYTDLFLMSINRSIKSQVLEDRISNLNEYHTYSVFTNTCRALFERHKLVFAFHMLVKILLQKEKLSLGEYLFLLKGGIVLDKATQPENPTKWLPENCWDNITELNKLPGFHGLIDSFETYSRDWQAWYMHGEPETQNLIAEWNAACNEFQRLLFVRSLRPDRLNSCITTYISNTIGHRYVEPPVLDLKVALHESSSKSPLLFVLSPGVDPTAELLQLAIDSKMFDKFHTLSLGQGQSEIAERLLEQGTREGEWVFLANCHLACAWLSTLRGLDAPTVNPRFRLWLSSMPDKAFPLQVLQNSIKMTTEPPQGIKGNMTRLFGNVNEDRFDFGDVKYRKLLFCVSFFHCMLVARKRFRQLGYNVVYSFNNSDFDASENLLSVYLQEYEEVPWDTLKYLFSIINYGGHVTDDYDMRVLTAYINQIFCIDALEIEEYRLSSVATYCMPPDGSLLSYRDHIEQFPGMEKAESIGLHSSADVACQAQDAIFACDSLLALIASGGAAEDKGVDEKVNALAHEMLQKLPVVIDQEVTERLMGPSAVMPLCVSLMQELGYFNRLVMYITDVLKELRLAIAGLIVMSESLEITYQCLFEGKVPPLWIKERPSVKTLGSWCREFSARGLHLKNWAAAPRTPPALCWLAAFNTPTGFLTAVMQTVAREEGWPIDTLGWDFTVLPLEESAFARPPQDGGVYIRGLFLEGASWNKKDACLTEPQAMQSVFPMSPIHFKPVPAGSRRLRNKYTCPAYYYPLRKGAFIIGVDLPAGLQNAYFWTKRGTALLCTLGT